MRRDPQAQAGRRPALRLRRVNRLLQTGAEVADDYDGWYVMEQDNILDAEPEGAGPLDDVLAKKLHVREHLKTIVHRETRAELQIMTFDPSVLTGQKPVAALIDQFYAEVQALGGGRQDTSALVRRLPRRGKA